VNKEECPIKRTWDRVEEARRITFVLGCKSGNLVFKVVHVNEDGSFESVWTGQATAIAQSLQLEESDYYHFHPISYKIGEVSRADKDCERSSIYCFRSLAGAKSAYRLDGYSPLDFEGGVLEPYERKMGGIAILACVTYDNVRGASELSDECLVDGAVLPKVVVWEGWSV